MAGVDYLTTAPKTGVVTTDLPPGYSSHSKRTWYIDTTGSGGTVKLSFDAATIGIPINNSTTYGLLYRSGTSGAFTEVATSTMSGGVASFDYLPADGVYAIGIISSIPPTITKTSCIISDPANNTNNPKRIPGGVIRYMFEINNTSSQINDVNVTDSVDGANFDISSIKNIQVQSPPCDCKNTQSASNNGSNGTGNGVNPVILDFGSISSGTSQNPTQKCGYFEVEIK